jgi:hypothetical protein
LLGLLCLLVNRLICGRSAADAVCH